MAVKTRSEWNKRSKLEKEHLMREVVGKLPEGFSFHRIELVVSPEGSVSSKGGDGGYNICGGADIFWGYLPVATYYRHLRGDGLEWADRLDHLYYRRIIRLGDAYE